MPNYKNTLIKTTTVPILERIKLIVQGTNMLVELVKQETLESLVQK